MDAKRVAWLEVVDDDLAVQLDPGRALAGEPLQAKAGAAEDAGAQALLEADGELHAGCGAHEAVAVDHVALVRRDLHGEDLAGELGGEGEQPWTSGGAVLGHEKGAARDRAP